MYILFGFLGFLIPVVIVIGVIFFLVKISRGNKDDKEEKSLTAKEVLIDGGIFLSLITSIVALVSIIFSAIDKKFVDVLKSDIYGYGNTLNEDVRVAVSVIIVAYPIYLGLAYYKARYLKNNPSRSALPATKHVNYITLGVAALFIVGSLVTTIYQYLGGELGASFFYKILTVVVISLSLALYSYYSLKRNYSQKSLVPNIFAIVSLIAVIVSVVYSVKILGSPSEVRRAKFDEKRLQDLSNVQQEVLNYWTRSKALPTTMSDVQGDGFNSSFVIPKDPRSKDAYTYKVLENSKMVRTTGQDCATYYPGRFNKSVYPTPNSTINDYNYEISKITCDIPSKATFEICATFETVRAYDENGIDQSSVGWDSSNVYGVRGIDPMSARYNDAFYYDSYNKNPNWNHNKGNTCFKRTINALKYPQY